MFYGAPGCFSHLMTTESNPLDTAPCYMPIPVYLWYDSAGTCKPSGCTVIASYENSRKLPGTLSERGLANRVRGGGNKRDKKTSKKDKKRNKNRERIEKGTKTIKQKRTVTLTPNYLDQTFILIK